MTAAHVTAAFCLGTVAGLIIGSTMARNPEPLPAYIIETAICPEMPIVVDCAGQIRPLSPGWGIK